jgi:hypothetical protein
MEPEDVLERLTAAEVLEEASDGLALTEAFQDRIAARREALSIGQASPNAGPLLETDDRLRTVFDGDPERIAVFQAVDAVTAGLDLVERVNTVAFVEQFRNGFPPAEGAPDTFTPVHASQLSYLTAVYSRAIVYVWRHDCDSCDVIRAEFEDIFDSHPSDLGLFAVYGPDDPQTLEDEFQAVAAPTTLFVADGAVDCRLLGAHHRRAIEAEIEKLRS